MPLFTGVIIAGKTERAALVLAEEQKAMLKVLSRSRSAPARAVERAQVLLGLHRGPLDDRPA